MTRETSSNPRVDEGDGEESLGKWGLDLKETEL